MGPLEVSLPQFTRCFELVPGRSTIIMFCESSYRVRYGSIEIIEIDSQEAVSRFLNVHGQFGRTVNQFLNVHGQVRQFLNVPRSGRMPIKSGRMPI